jgi:hypothetical protein
MQEPSDHEQISESESAVVGQRLSPVVMIACCWPILLVAVGGLIGGLLGGVACAVNMALYRSSLPRWSLWILNPAVGLTALLIWIVVAVAIELMLSGSGTP